MQPASSESRNATVAAAQQKNVTIGVSIPAATHGWTGGVAYHAQETAKLLEKGYPGLKEHGLRGVRFIEAAVRSSQERSALASV